MNTQRIHIKFYLEDDLGFDPKVLIPAFHRIIQQRALDEMLIDVVDYRHVPNGPGVLLIAHEADLRFDSTDGRPGLLYARKRGLSGTFAERLRTTFRQAVRAARAVEQEVAELRVPGHRWSLRIADRLHAPNTRDTLPLIAPTLRELAEELHGGVGLELGWEEDSGSLFGIQITAAEALGTKTLLDRLESSSLAAAAA